MRILADLASSFTEPVVQLKGGRSAIQRRNPPTTSINQKLCLNKLHFPFGKIKIDQSFIRQAQQNPDSLAIVRIAALGKALGVPTTAEGVETEEQRIAMRDSGCTYCQGYLFGAGLPKDQITAMLGRQRASIRKPAYR